MAVLIDPPGAEGHGRVWSHLASDTSYDELHAFAHGIGLPERGFDGDHYDVPSGWYDEVVAAGALPVSSRELVERLTHAGLRRRKPRSLLPRPLGRALLRPSRLRPGDVVAVVSPAGPIDVARLERGVAVLRSWGLVVREPSSKPTSHRIDYLAESDQARAKELTRAWTDPEVRAVWATRGGYGTQRFLDLLDWTTLAATTPKMLVGFSDLTALHQAVATQLGLATVHGHGVGALGDAEGPHSLETTRRLVMEGGPLTLSGSPGGAGPSVDAVVVGGNVSLLASSVGTSGARPAAHGIALLEDVGEQPYRLDRALTQLLRSGWFDDVRGIAQGAFTGCGDPAEVRRVLDERLAPLGVPTVQNLPVGHIAENHPVPLGLPARLDPVAGTLSFARTLR